MLSLSDLQHVKSFYDLIQVASQKHGNKTAMQIRRRIINEKISYAELPQYIHRTINYLDSLGVKKGEKVLVWGVNCPEYLLLLLAIFASGRTAVPLDFRTNPDTAKKIITQSKPAAAFVSIFSEHKFIKGLVKKTEIIEELRTKIFKEKSTVTPDQLEVDLSQPCELLYTSGTTGTPKGVMMHQSKIIAMAKAALPYIPKLKEYTTISILPLSHVLEQVLGTAVAMTLGTKTTYLTRINSAKMRKAMQEEHPTYLVFVPQLLSVFWQRIEATAEADGKIELLFKMMRLTEKLPYFLRRKIFKKVHHGFGGKLQFVVSSGAPLSPVLAKRFDALGFKILEVYGATEILAATINTTAAGIGTVGSAVNGVEIKIAEDKEILIKSPFATEGYFNNPEKNKDTFVDGWYRTGDIGHFDKEKRLIISGRDTFKLVLGNGENIYVEDLETKISNHKKVKSCCVIGLDDNGADKVHALFILKDEKDDVGLDDIVQEINSTLESKQQIYSYAIWRSNDFPRTHTLKVDRHKVKDYVLANLKSGKHNESETTFVAGSQMSIHEAIALVSKKPLAEITSDKVLTSDLGMDSLQRAELTSVIEENLGVFVDYLKINAQTTVADIETLAKTATVESAVNTPTWQYSSFWTFIRKVLMTQFVLPLHGIFVKLDVDKEAMQALDLKDTIIAYNHPGMFDFMVILRLFKKNCHNAIGLAGANFWKSKILGRLLELGGSIPIDQTGNNLLAQLELQSDLVAKGKYLIIAPEGMMQREGKQNKFQNGVGFIAKELGLKILPVKIEGYAEILPPPAKPAHEMSIWEWIKHSLPKKRGQIKISIGKAIEPKVDESATHLTTRLEKEFSKL